METGLLFQEDSTMENRMFNAFVVEETDEKTFTGHVKIEKYRGPPERGCDHTRKLFVLEL